MVELAESRGPNYKQSLQIAWALMWRTLLVIPPLYLFASVVSLLTSNLQGIFIGVPLVGLLLLTPFVVRSAFTTKYRAFVIRLYCTPGQAQNPNDLSYFQLLRVVWLWMWRSGVMFFVVQLGAKLLRDAGVNVWFVLLFTLALGLLVVWPLTASMKTRKRYRGFWFEVGLCDPSCLGRDLQPQEVN
jgi:hypothetical protein